MTSPNFSNQGPLSTSFLVSVINSVTSAYRKDRKMFWKNQGFLQGACWVDGSLAAISTDYILNVPIPSTPLWEISYLWQLTANIININDFKGKVFTFTIKVMGGKTLMKFLPLFSHVFMGGLWWTRWQWERFTSQHHGFLLFVSFHKWWRSFIHPSPTPYDLTNWHN
jgi:hypothetical protein